MTNTLVRNIERGNLYKHMQKISEHQDQDFRASSVGTLVRKYLSWFKELLTFSHIVLLKKTD